MSGHASWKLLWAFLGSTNYIGGELPMQARRFSETVSVGQRVDHTARMLA
jgi:hypothetical protein